MSLKQELQIWSNALDAFDVQEFDLSLSLFQEISDSSKILFNLGLIHATIGSHATAVECFDQAVSLDQYLAVAYFQEGVSNFLLGRYEVARRDFDDAFVYMRSNLTIDYEQLGLKFRLYSCEVLFNRGLASIYMGLQDQGMADLQAALQEKQTDEHSVIDEAITDRGDGYTVFSIPVGVLFRPSATKLKNLETKNYLGQAKLIAATDARDAFTGFSGTNAPLAPQRSNSDPLDRGGPTSLSRSMTSAARLENSGDGVARPLRRRPTVEEMGGASGGRRMSLAKPLGVGRSRTMALGGRGAGLPTPPPSEGRIPPQQQQGNGRPVTYGGLLESYYNGAGGEDDLPTTTTIPALLPMRPTLPLLTTSTPLLPTNKHSPSPIPRSPSSAGTRPPHPEGQPIDRVAKWARLNAGAGPPPPPPMQQGSISRQSSASERGGGMGQAKMAMAQQRSGGGLMRQGTLGGFGARAGRVEMGEGGEEYENMTAFMGEREMSKVRVKLRFQGDTRGMSITPDLAHQDFVERVRVKFASAFDLPMKYKDSDGALVSIIDADDWESAMDQAREAAEGRAEGKLEIVLADS